MRKDRRDAEGGQQGVHEQPAADPGDRQETVAPAATQRIAHDQERVGAGRDRHQRRDERESEDLRVEQVHEALRRKQPALWSFTIPTACMKA